MNCTKCEHETRVIDTRLTELGIRRRRWCTECGTKFSTLEVLADTVGYENPRRGRPKAKPKPVPSAKQRAQARRRVEDKQDATAVSDYD